MKTFFSIIFVLAIFALMVWVLAKSFQTIRHVIQKKKSKSVDADSDKQGKEDN